MVTAYTEVSESNPRYNYHQTHYKLQSVPESGAKTADMYIPARYSNGNMTLYMVWSP